MISKARAWAVSALCGLGCVLIVFAVLRLVEGAPWYLVAWLATYGAGMFLSAALVFVYDGGDRDGRG